VKCPATQITVQIPTEAFCMSTAANGCDFVPEAALQARRREGRSPTSGDLHCEGLGEQRGVRRRSEDAWRASHPAPEVRADIAGGRPLARPADEVWVILRTLEIGA
jgi:hypothetical protein